MYGIRLGDFELTPVKQWFTLLVEFYAVCLILFILCESLRVINLCLLELFLQVFP